MTQTMANRFLLICIILGIAMCLWAQPASMKFHVTNLRSDDMATGPWMFDSDDPGMFTHDGNPFTFEPGVHLSHNYAYRVLEWTAGTTGVAISENLSMVTSPAELSVNLEPFTMSAFEHINVVNPDADPFTLGQAGDWRKYTNGIIHFYQGGVEKMRVLNGRISVYTPYWTAAQMHLNLLAAGYPNNWQNDLGPGTALRVTGWGDIDVANSDPAWVAEYANPYNNQVALVFTNPTFIVNIPYGYYTFDCEVIPAYHTETLITPTVPAGPNIFIAGAATNLDCYFTDCTSGGAIASLRDMSITRIDSTGTGIFPPEILRKGNTWWEVGTTLAAFNGELTFDRCGCDLGTAPSWRVLFRQIGSQTWHIWTNTQVLDDNHIKALGVYSFSEWTLGSIEPDLPVELSSFTATLTSQQNVNLQWVTQSETNNMGFNVLRSADNELAHAVRLNTEIIAGTNTEVTHQYDFLDTDVIVNNTYYYWLESVAMNGSSEFHGGMSVYVQDNHTQPLAPAITQMSKSYPNPFVRGNQTTLRVQVKASDTGTVSIYNVKGQLMKSYPVQTGEYDIQWDGRDKNGKLCAAGVYFSKLQTNTTRQTKKILVLQ